MCRSKHVEPLKNFGIINFITKLHLVSISTEFITFLCSDPKTCVVIKSYCNSCFPWSLKTVILLVIIIVIIQLDYYYCCFCRAGRPFAINPLKPELNSICYLLALLDHHFLHVSRIRVKSLTFRRLMSYMYMEHPFLMFIDHTQRRSTVGRTPLDE